MLSLRPFKSVIDLLRIFNTEEKCIRHLEVLRWEGNVVSPFDATSKVYKCSNNRYKCTNTNKYFNVRTETIFEGTKISLQKWFVAVYLFIAHKKGISSYQLAEELDVTQKTAWFILSRVRYAMEHETFIKEMEGIVQLDETFVGGKNKNRHNDKKVKNSQGRSFKDKTPVLGMLDDKGQVKCFVVPDTKASSIQPIIRANIKEGSTIYTDEWSGYGGLYKYYQQGVVDHGKGQYVNGEITTNAIENFWSHLKRGIIGVYHKTSRKHLQKYADEFSFRFNFRNESVNDRFNIFLCATKGKRITYSNLVK